MGNVLGGIGMVLAIALAVVAGLFCLGAAIVVFGLLTLPITFILSFFMSTKAALIVVYAVGLLFTALFVV